MNMDWKQNKFMVTLMGLMLLRSAFTANIRESFHVAIIDAGSTGTRITGFAFHTSNTDGNLILDNEFFQEEKPGLSFYADKPKDVMESLQKLVNKTKSEVPESKWADTPIFFRATAGLRLLPESKAEALLEECKKFLNTSGFQVNEKSVSIMEGKDEGIFSWLSVNFLLDRFSSENTKGKVAALDLGGGSTQVTFVPDEGNSKKLEKDIHSIRALDQNMNIYTHSYLGNGLMAARKMILVPNSGTENKNGTIEVRSECMSPESKTPWSYDHKEYIIQGSSNGTQLVQDTNSTGVDEKGPSIRFKRCLQIANNFTNTIVDKPSGLDNQEIYAFSYFFDRAQEVGLIDRKTGGNLTVDSYHQAALRICNSENEDHPFMCLDLTYIYSLLKNGYGLNDSTKLNVHKRINNHYLSWSLGAAFSVLQERDSSVAKSASGRLSTGFAAFSLAILHRLYSSCL